MNTSDMRIAIERKRDGGELNAALWGAIVGSYLDGSVDEAQFAALCMACVWRGMSAQETYALTDAMVRSGETLHFDAGTVVDKHSSGGVSDIVSLVAVPVAAACGARVAKLSGRALGHTGGTIDKLESIPGFDASLSTAAFVAQVERVGCAIAAQSAALVPADKRIYALRDRTGTVPSLGLIAASILSKKIAGGAHAFVFDVKTGRAAFMRDPADAAQLAHALVELSARFGRRATALVTDMNEPLGRSIGTGIEIIEARELLQGTSASDERLRTLTVEIASEMLEQAGVGGGAQKARDALASGAAYKKFVEMIEAQGATRTALERMQAAEPRAVVRAPRAGFVSAIDVVRLGTLGREYSAHDSLAGLRVETRIGERIETGAPALTLYGIAAAPPDLSHAFEITDEAPPRRPLIYERSTSATR